MNKAETASAAFFVVIGAAMFKESLKLPYVIEDVPGPGFFPLYISIGIFAIGFGLAVRGIRSGTSPPGKMKWPALNGWWQIGIMAGALFIFILLLDSLGFPVAASLFIAGVAYGMGVHSWKLLASVSIFTAAALYTIFAIWLKVPLPRGVLEFFV